jgi:phosphate transport system protein
MQKHPGARTMHDHTSKNFDLELESLRTRVLQMGGMVEQQVRKAIEGLYSGDQPLLEAVIRDDERVNQMEVDIDDLCNKVIAKRQPTAIDLRMIVSVLKAISDLERVGDKARKIARLGIALANQPVRSTLNVELNHMADTALRMLRLALDGFARLDVSLVTEAMHLDKIVNAEYQSVARQLITYMMEDPRTITRSLDILSIAKAIERVGDHATNIAEYVVYMVKGLNVRHASAEEVEAKIADS